MVEYERPEAEQDFDSGRWSVLMERTKSLYRRMWGNREEREMGDGE